jgi:hypothetical protein
MQWQTVAHGLEKDKWERRLCSEVKAEKEARAQNQHNR